MFGTVGHYSLNRKLGDGASCTVYQATHDTQEDLTVALKLIKTNIVSAGAMSGFNTEVDSLKELDHPNIVKLIDADDNTQHVKRNGTSTPAAFLALELVSGGELFDFVAEGGAFSEEVARYYFKQLIEAICYMQGKGMSHRDLKLQNVLLSDEFLLKVADFGFATLQTTNQSLRGTEGFMAPEIINNQEYNGEKIDIFAAGVILFTMVARRPPFVDARPEDAYYNLILSNRSDFFWKVHCRSLAGGLGYFSDDFKSLFLSLISPDPNERPSLAEIMSHPWYTGDVPSSDDINSEFTERLTIIREANNIGSQPDEVAGPSAFGGEVHRSGEEIKIPEGDREAGEYVKGVKCYTELFTTTSTKKLFELLCLYAQESSTQCDFDENLYSATLKSSAEETGDVVFNLSILKVDESTNCVQATLEQGDRFTFSDTFKKIRNFFVGKQVEQS